MNDSSLYRKYRPQTFSNLVGQDHVRITLMNALQENRAVHAYLFCGPRGTGKTSTARLLAKALNCENPAENREPCEVCDLCRDITDGRLIDLVEIDAASNRRIDEIRELRDKIHFAPTRAKNKIYIIDEVHMLTKEAFNALLKMLEEPPAQVYFILATTEAYKIPETIISRCQRFDFKRIDPKTIMTRLNYIAQLEGIVIEERAIEAIAQNVDGGLRDAIGLFEQLVSDKKLEYARVKQVLGISGNDTIASFYQFLRSNDLSGILGFLQELHRDGHDFSQFTKELIQFLRGALLDAVNQKNDSEVSFLLKAIEIFQQAYGQFRAALIPQLPLEIAVMKFLRPEILEMNNVAEISPSASVSAAAPIPNRIATKKIPSAPLKSLPDESAKESLKTPEIPKDLSLETAWPRVVELVKTPSLRQSLKHIKKMSLPETHIVQLEFLSKFYMEKVMESTLRAELESALEKIFGRGMKVTGMVQKLQLESVASQPDHDIADEAAEIFGGQVVEE